MWRIGGGLESVHLDVVFVVQIFKERTVLSLSSQVKRSLVQRGVLEIAGKTPSSTVLPIYHFSLPMSIIYVTQHTQTYL